jgi:hypothetical protein
VTGPAAIIADATWLAHRFDEKTDAVHFMRVTRAQHEAATFITDDYLPKGLPVRIIPRGDATAAASPPAPLHFIFHSAFCCSTLLARALDLPGTSMGLKEPVILNDIVGWRHRGGGTGAAVARALDHALRLLARPFEAGEAIVIKPSNITNGLAPAMLSLHKDASALLLHAPLETFLRSVAKKGIDGRLWVRDLMAAQLREGFIDLGLEGDDYLKLTDLQAAAVGWLSQHALFARLSAQFGARVATLDSETLLARPHETMTALARLYGLALNAQAIAGIVAGPAFTRHSKTDAAFGREARSREYADAADAHGDEIAKVAVWAEAVAKSAGISMALPAPLIA